MIELTQTSLYPKGNCWQTAVACLLEIDPELLPSQVDSYYYEKREDGTEVKRMNYNNPLQTYLIKHHNLAYVELHSPPETLEFLQVAPPGFHIMTGLTVRSAEYGGERHVVVGRYGKVAWDPHPSRAGLIGEINWAFIVPFPKSWADSWSRRTEVCVCPQCKG